MKNKDDGSTHSAGVVTGDQTKGSGKSTRVKSYEDPDTRVIYVYHPPSYYNGYGSRWPGVYYPPPYDPSYHDVICDRFYYRNYVTEGTCWYNQPYPEGYVVRNGEFVPIASSSSGAGAILVILLVLVVAAVAVWLVMRAMSKRDRGPREPTVSGGFGDDI